METQDKARFTFPAVGTGSDARDITRSPKKTKKRLLRENNLNILTSTLKQVLKEEGWVVNIYSKKQILTKERAKNRLVYTKNRLKELSNINFTKIIFLDKSSIERGQGSRVEFSRNRPKYRQNLEIYSTKNKSKIGRAHV